MSPVAMGLLPHLMYCSKIKSIGLWVIKDTTKPPVPLKGRLRSRTVFIMDLSIIQKQFHICNKLIFCAVVFLLFTFSVLTAPSQNISSQNQILANTGSFCKSFDGTKIYYEARGNGEPV